MEIKVKYLGTDYWDREVFQGIEGGRFYKRESERSTFYTASSFDGEPEFPLKDGVTVVIIE